MSKLASVVFLSSALWAVSASGEEASKLFEEIAVPVDYQGRQIQLTGWFKKPVGAGPFPVVIALHSCSGYYANMSGGALPLWVPFLQGHGYATFKLDSFTARGHSDVCATHAVTTADRAADVLAAAALLAGRPDVRPDRIAERLATMRRRPRTPAFARRNFCAGRCSDSGARPSAFALLALHVVGLGLRFLRGRPIRPAKADPW